MTSQDFNLKYNAERDQFEGQFKAKVTSLGPVNQENSNGTEYAVGSVQMTTAHGELKEVSAICYKKNVEKGITVGETYICNVAVTKDRPNEPIISISPLTSAVRATADDFGFVFADALAEVGVGAEEVA
jgi:hypothetical protein